MVIALVALCLSVGGFALAATSQDGVIHGCYKKHGGALSIVAVGKKCPRGTRSVSWNQQGPKGTGGPKGTSGSKGAAGAQGAEGKKGDAGTAVAYARVAAEGALEPGDSGRQNKNVIGVDVEHGAGTTGLGHYCFGGLPFGVASAMVSPDSAGDADGVVITSVAVQRGVELSKCDAQHQQARVTTLVEGKPADHRFQIWFEATGGPQIAAGVGGE